MTAVFSPCRRYRYRLDRYIGAGGPPVTFLLHNPSTANETDSDATLRRGMAFAHRWGCDTLTFINPWARVATQPQELWKTTDPVGPENDSHIDQVIREMIQGGGFVVCAWGVIRTPTVNREMAATRLIEVRSRLRRSGCDVRILGANKDGSPKHPLYLRANVALAEWVGI